MEPQIIDYYNGMPSGLNVIDKMNYICSECESKEIIIKKLVRGVEKNEDKSNIYLKLLRGCSDTGYELSTILPDIIDRHYNELEDLKKEYNQELNILTKKYDNEIKELNKLIDFYRESWLND